MLATNRNFRCQGGMNHYKMIEWWHNVVSLCAYVILHVHFVLVRLLSRIRWKRREKDRVNARSTTVQEIVGFCDPDYLTISVCLIKH